jgi:hypothetical protein
MTKRKRIRDYRAEYARRIARGRAKGLSRSQARGHPAANEKHISRKRKPAPLDDHRLQAALRSLRQEKSLSATAREIGVSPERLRHHLASANLAKKRGRRWKVRDDLPRRLLIYSEGRAKAITVANRKAAALVGLYMSSVQTALRTGDRGWISLFDGSSMTDSAGVRHPFETNMNTLYRLANLGGESFEQVYRIVT